MDIARRAHLNGQLSALAFNDPKRLPKSVDELLGRRPEPMTKAQWEAVIKTAVKG